MKIIDRKKDLVKLQFGEYVSLGKVESELKTCPLVENVCVYGDATKIYTVALVVPDRNKLTAWAGKSTLQKLVASLPPKSVLSYQHILEGCPDRKLGRTPSF